MRYIKARGTNVERTKPFNGFTRSGIYINPRFYDFKQVKRRTKTIKVLLRVVLVPNLDFHFS